MMNNDDVQQVDGKLNYLRHTRGTTILFQTELIKLKYYQHFIIPPQSDPQPPYKQSSLLYLLSIQMSELPICTIHKKTCQLICKQPQCPTTFICQQKECIQKHLHCNSFIGVRYINKRLHQHQHLIDIYYKEGQDLVQQYFDQFSQKTISLINQYKEEALHQLKEIKGKTMLNKDWGDPQIIEALHKDFYGCPKDKVLKGWEIFKEGNDHFFDGSSINRMVTQLRWKIDNLPTLVQRMSSSYLFKFRNSQSYLADLLTEQQQNILFKLLSEENIGPHNLELLFNAGQNNFMAMKFHSKCDDKGPTLTIVRSTSGSIFGGYNSISWNCSGIKQAKGSFLFSIDFQSICISNKPDKRALVYDIQSYGPSWGSNANQDLCIANNCQGGASYSNMNNNYSFTKENISSTSLFRGANTFQVQNYMVFKVNI